MRIKKINYKHFLISAIACGCLFTACDFEEINEPKYQITADDMKGDNFNLGAFFPQLQDIAYPAQENNYQMNENLIGDVYGRYMMTGGKWPTKNFAVYNAPEGWVKFPFNNVMGNVYTAWNEIRKLTSGEGVNFAWAQILRVTAMQRLTDMYGPIPYSKVASGDLKVPYDSQEEAYKAMFVDLTDAIDVLTTFVVSNPGSFPMAQYDGVYGGDFSKWVKYANSLKLRMAMRIRFADADLARRMAEEAINHTIGVITSNTDNAKYSYEKGNPLHIMWDSYSDCRLCADITCYMTGYKDPRMTKYFQETTMGEKKGYFGIRSGLNSPGTQYSTQYSSPNVVKEDPLYWMYASEISFLRAEGAAIGWDMNGTAEQFYNDGIRLSFEQVGASGVETYLANSDLKQADYEDPNNSASINAVSTITIKWDESASAEEKLERIITQKWIALWPMGQEAWSEYRRTGFPKMFPLAQNTAYGNLLIANRIPFSADEYLNNKENMPAAKIALGGEDNYATHLWWDKYRK